MTPELRRVFFDSNTGDSESGYLLTFQQSLSDIDQLGEVKNGDLVTLYMPNEIEVTARLEFDDEQKCWRGIPVGSWRNCGDASSK